MQDACPKIEQASQAFAIQQRGKPPLQSTK
jgi:hypothetical protein